MFVATRTPCSVWPWACPSLAPSPVALGCSKLSSSLCNIVSRAVSKNPNTRIFICIPSSCPFSFPSSAAGKRNNHEEPKGNYSEEKGIMFLQRKARLTGLKSSNSWSERAGALWYDKATRTLISQMQYVAEARRISRRIKHNIWMIFQTASSSTKKFTSLCSTL